MSREPLIVQKFLPDVSKGDKRIILVNGEPVGAINRVPQLRRNPLEHACRRAAREDRPDPPRSLRFVLAIGPTLRDKGQVFVGIDVIGDYLTEISVTSPTGIQELERF